MRAGSRGRAVATSVEREHARARGLRRAAALAGLAGLLLAAGGCRVRALLYPVPAVRVPSPPPPPLWEADLELADGTRVGAWAGGAQSPQRGRPVLLFFHGNGENLETMRRAGLFDELLALGAGFLAIDYPGYGRSGGRPSEPALERAAAAALRRIEEERPGEPVVAAGWSLGAALALRLAAERPDAVAGVAALSAWTSLPELARVHFPGFLVRLLLRERYDSLAAAEGLRLPVLVIHGGRDRIVPAAHGRRLAAALARGRWVEIPQAGHNDLLGHPRVWRELAGFLEEIAPPNGFPTTGAGSPG